MQPKLRTNTNLAIHVPDIGAAEAFYCGVLGFEVIDRQEHRLTLNTGDITLYVVEDGRTMPFIPALETADLDATRTHLAEHGARIVHDWQPSRTIYFEDPFGIVWDAVEVKEGGAPGGRLTRSSHDHQASSGGVIARLEP